MFFFAAIYHRITSIYSLLFSSFEIKALDEEHFDAVDLVETAFNKLAENVVSIYLVFNLSLI